MINWCNANAGFVSSLLTLVYVLANLIIVGVMIHANKLNRKATETAVQLERQRSRPVVVLEFIRESGVWTLRVKNAGLSVARSITFSISPEPKMCFGGENAVPKEKTEKRLPLFQNGMPSLAPGGEITTALGTLARMKEAFGGLRFRGTITYTDEAGTGYSSPVDIDLGVYESLTYLSRKGLHEIGTELEKLQREIHLLASGFYKPHVLTEDIKEHRQAQEELLRHAEEVSANNQRAEQHAGKVSFDAAPSASPDEPSA